MSKIAVIGDYDSIYGFASLGLTTFPVEAGADPQEAAEMLHRIVEGGYGIIYMTEQLAASLTKEIAKYQDSMLPAIIQIPGVTGNTGAGVAGVRKTVEQAVGSDILFGDM